VRDVYDIDIPVARHENVEKVLDVQFAVMHAGLPAVAAFILCATTAGMTLQQCAERAGLRWASQAQRLRDQAEKAVREAEASEGRAGLQMRSKSGSDSTRRRRVERRG
jgi:hypothetical protein